MCRHHIAFAIERLVGQGGGAERVTFDVAAGLAERGHRVSILHYDIRRGDLPFTPYECVSVENLADHPWLRMRYLAGHVGRKIGQQVSIITPQREWIGRYGPFARAIEAYSYDAPLDAVVAMMPPAIAAVEMAPLPRHVIKAASIHNTPANEYENPARWGMGVYGGQRRLLSLHGFDRVGVLLPEFKAWHDARLPHPTTVVPNMIHPVSPEQRAQPGQSRTIIAASRLSGAKRIHLLLEAWSVLRHAYPDWTLEIYGDGELRDDLEARARALDVPLSVFQGHTSNIGAIHKRAAILAHPADQEGFCLAVGEALAAGVPAVGFRECPGVNTLIQNDINGLLVPAGENPAASLRSGLDRLMVDAELRMRLGKMGPQTMKAYSPSMVLDCWEEFLFGTS